MYTSKDHLKMDARRVVGKYLRQATRQVSHELGGEELWLQVEALMGSPNRTLPNLQALRLLDELYPGSAHRVFDLVEKLHEEEFENQWSIAKRQLFHLQVAVIIIITLVFLVLACFWLIATYA